MLGVQTKKITIRSEEHTSELQSHDNRVCRLLLEKKIGEGYGLTEVTMMAHVSPPFQSRTRKPGTLGAPIFESEISFFFFKGGAPPQAGERAQAGVRGT